MPRITLVLLPGMDGSGRLFAPFIDGLRGEFDVRVQVYPGDAPFGHDELTAMAAASIPDDGPYVILGESFSGPIAIRLADSASPRLRGLILCCSFAANPRPEWAGLHRLIPWLPIVKRFVPAMAHLVLGRFSTSALRAGVADSLASVSTSALRARIASVLRVDESSAWARLRVPLLYLRATADRLVPAHVASSLQGLQPQLQIIDIEAPHFLLQAAPQAAARAVAGFVHSLPEAR